jgi:hypothetical protein
MQQTVKIAVDAELAPLVQEIQKLWLSGESVAIRNGLTQLIADLSADMSVIANIPKDTEDGSDYVKSWSEILNVQMYVDTDIYGDRQLDPPNTGETVIQHEQATEIYLQSWAEVAKDMSNLPHNLYTKLWTTVEIAKILDCSPAMLRRARKEQQLPIKVNDFLLDCVSHDGKRSLWFVRPA